MEISDDLLKWLIKIKVLPPSTGHPLEDSLIKQFSNGYIFGQILVKIHSTPHPKSKLPSIKALSSISDQESQSVKVQNWQILDQTLSSLDIGLTSTQKAQIIACKKESIESLIRMIHSYYIRSSPASSHRPQKVIEKTQSIGFIDLLDTSKALSQSESSLEFLLLSFCHSFSLIPKQAAGLLTYKGKYLKYIVCSGFKEKFRPVIMWYQSLTINSQHLGSLMKNEEIQGSVELILSTCKHGFSSKNLETVQACTEFYNKIAEELSSKSMRNTAWDWLTSEGLSASLIACKKFGVYIKRFVVSFYVQLGKGRLRELFVNHLEKHENYLGLVNEFLPHLLEINVGKQELMAERVFEEWVEIGLREANSDRNSPSDRKIKGFLLVCDIWVFMPNLVEVSDKMDESILNMMKRLCRDFHWVVRCMVHGKLFQFLKLFGNQRSSYAPMIYKILIFSLIENYKDEEIRELILSNFIIELKENEEIPISVLIEPLAKHLQGNIKSSMREIEFLTFLAGHSKLVFKNAFQVFEILMKFYINDSKLSKAAFIPISTILRRYIEEVPLQDSLMKLFKQAFKYAYNLGIKKVKDLKKDKNITYQRDIIFDLIKLCIHLQNDSFNHEIETQALQTNHYLEKAKGDNESLLQILSLFKYSGTFSSDKVDKSNFDLSYRTPRQKKKVKTKLKLAETSPVRAELQKSISKEGTFILSPEEKEKVDSLLKKYDGIFKLLFKKYANTGYKVSVTSEGFDSLSASKFKMSISEYYKLLKENGVSANMLSFEELSSIIKSISHRIHKGEVDLSYAQFLQTISFVASFVYSRGAHDLSHFGPGVCLQALIDLFKQTNRQLKKVKRAGFGDQDILRGINEQLLKNPKTPIPVGYKKVTEKDIIIKHEIPSTVKMNESKRVCLGIMEDILFKVFGFHILEPQVHYKEITRVKGTASATKIKGSVSPKLKYEVSKLNGKYLPEVLSESALLLDDIINSVEKKSPRLIKKGEIYRPSNSIMSQREQKRIFEEEENALKERKRRIRKRFVERKLEEMRAQRSEEDRVQEDLYLKQQEREIERKVIHDRKKAKSMMEKKELINEWKKKKQEELYYETEDDYERKQQINEFLAREHEKISNMLMETTARLKYNQSVQKRKEAYKERYALNQKEITKKLLEEDKTKKANEEKLKEKIDKMLQEKRTKDFLNLYKDSLKAVFNHYKNLVDLKHQITDLPYMNLYAFNKFTSQFNIWPGLVSADEVQTIFKKITKNNKHEKNLIMTYKGFLHALLRISILSTEILQKTVKKKAQTGEGLLKALLDWMQITTDKFTTLEYLRHANSVLLAYDSQKKKTIGNEINRKILKEGSHVQGTVIIPNKHN